jgi:predicted PurR-regulated permease PerM
MVAMRPRWSPQVKLIVSLLLLAFSIYLLFRFRVILIPLILAIIISFVISPLVNSIQGMFGIRRGLATALCYLCLLAIFITLLVGVIPLLSSQTSDLSQDVLILLRNLGSLVDHQYTIAGQVIDGAAAYRQALVTLQGLLQPVFGRTLQIVVEVISSIIWIIFVPVVSFYLVKDGPALRVWMEGLIPPDYRLDYIHLRDEINSVWSSFFRGQVILALVVSLLFTGVGLILGLPFPLAMGVMAGLLEFLPSLGHGIWLVIASILAFFLGSTWLPVPNIIFVAIVIALHLFYQQFDLNYLIPRIIGQSVRLPPLVVILGIVSGAVFAGVLGVLLAAPTIASARVLGRYVFANLLDLDPFPQSVITTLPPPNPHWWRKTRSEGMKETNVPSGTEAPVIRSEREP